MQKIFLEDYDGNDDRNDFVESEQSVERDLQPLEQVRGKDCLSAEFGSRSKRGLSMATGGKAMFGNICKQVGVNMVMVLSAYFISSVK